MPETKNLKSIAEIYKSDKIEHQYIKVYESYFEKIRDEKLKILEIRQNLFFHHNRLN